MNTKMLFAACFATVGLLVCVCNDHLGMGILSFPLSMMIVYKSFQMKTKVCMIFLWLNAYGGIPLESTKLTPQFSDAIIWQIVGVALIIFLEVNVILKNIEVRSRA